MEAVLEHPTEWESRLARAGLCVACEDWRGSSYRATAGLAFPEPFLAVKSLLALLSPAERTAAARFRGFCETIVPKRQRVRSDGTPGPSRPPAASAVRPSR